MTLFSILSAKRERKVSRDQEARVGEMTEQESMIVDNESACFDSLLTGGDIDN